MRLIATILLGLAAIAAGTSASRAEDGCGRGWHWNGYRCAPTYYAPPPRYDDRDHDDWRWRHRDRRDDYDSRDHDWRHSDDGGSSYRPPDPRWHTPNGCPPNFTVQDGLCKPYRGGGRVGSHGYYPPDRRKWHTFNGCQPAYTVQGGLCKPYVGAGYFPPDHRKWHTPNGCQPHFTVQDGLCKPYRGY